MIVRDDAYRQRVCERIRELIHEGDTNAVKSELERNMWVIGWAEKLSPLQYCALHTGNTELVEDILMRGGNPNCIVNVEDRPVAIMVYAILHSTPEMVRILLDRGAKPLGSVEMVRAHVVQLSDGIVGIGGFERMDLSYLKLSVKEDSPEKVNLLIGTNAYSVKDIAEAAAFAQEIRSERTFSALKDVLERMGAPFKEIPREDDDVTVHSQERTPIQAESEDLVRRFQSLRTRIEQGTETEEDRSRYPVLLSDYIKMAKGIEDTLRQGTATLREIIDLLEAQNPDIEVLKENADALRKSAETMPLPVVFTGWTEVCNFIEREMPFLVGANADPEKHYALMEGIDEVLAFSSKRLAEIRGSRRIANKELADQMEKRIRGTQ